MQISVIRSRDLDNFPIIEGSIPFSIFKSSEQSGACGTKPEAYVIDTDKDWKYVVDKINSGNFVTITHFPNPDLEKDSLLVYLFGEFTMSGNMYAIDKIEGIPSLQSIFINIKIVAGEAEALSCPYLIITIPKTGYKTVVFEVIPVGWIFKST